jgi:hypothetical protein
MPPKAQDGRFPSARIKRIMQVDPDVGQIAKETPPVVSAVLEQYLSELIAAAADSARGAAAAPRPAATLSESLLLTVDHSRRAIAQRAAAR